MTTPQLPSPTTVKLIPIGRKAASAPDSLEGYGASWAFPCPYHHQQAEAESRCRNELTGTGSLPARWSASHAAQASPVALLFMEYLALHDGMLQPVTTTADALVPHGEPFRERPDVRGRSGVPEGLVTTDHIPGRCTCSWAYTMGRLTLKYANTACPVLSDHRPA